MKTYNEIKEFMLNLSLSEATQQDKQTLQEIADQLSFKYNNCGCKSMYGELYTKITNWLKNHTELCHYKMAFGVLIYLEDGTLCTATNITDDLAKRMIEEGKDKYLTLIIPFDETEEVVTDEQVSNLKEKSAEVKARKSGKRITKSKK